ncbi:hypothetical protein [Nostoc sp. WHI]|uniref:hypothetical protein n=1 Tax=Nostoc sp. WHI TaxID=2650611 RepID=UPI0018C5BC44|nr:hypothetical protein [Nostoc sp. WHI]MBG1270183.1 hypothetical protein [Nostoc sp. WHI]
MKGFRKLSSIAMLLFAFVYPPSLAEAKDISLSHALSEQSAVPQATPVVDKTGELLIAQRRFKRYQNIQRRQRFGRYQNIQRRQRFGRYQNIQRRQRFGRYQNIQRRQRFGRYQNIQRRQRFRRYQNIRRY